MDSLSKLPNELIDKITLSICGQGGISYSTARAISRLAQTCRLFYHLINKYVSYVFVQDVDRSLLQRYEIVSWVTNPIPNFHLIDQIYQSNIILSYQPCTMCNQGNYLQGIFGLCTGEWIAILWWSGCWGYPQEYLIGVYPDRITAELAINNNFKCKHLSPNYYS